MRLAEGQRLNAAKAPAQQKDKCCKENCCCITTKHRNRHINCCVNIWSIPVFLSLGMAVTAGIILFLRTDKVVNLVFDQLKYEVDALNAMATNLQNIGGGCSPCSVSDFTDEGDFTAQDLEDTYTNMHPTLKEGVCEEVVRQLGPSDPAMAALDCTTDAQGNNDLNLDELLDLFNNRRRRLADDSGLPTGDTVDEFRDYGKYVKFGLIALMGLAPFLIMIAMIFFCCNLKFLSNEEEGRWEECCGCCGGCIFMPILFILALVIGICGCLVILVTAVILGEPFDILFKVLELAKDPPSDFGGIMDVAVPILKTGWEYGWKGTMCDGTASPGATHEPANFLMDGTYLINRVIVKANGATDDQIDGLCNNWLLGYRFGVVAQALVCLAAFTGIFTAFYLGYKACCRNRRQRDQVRLQQVQLVTGPGLKI